MRQPNRVAAVVVLLLTVAACAQPPAGVEPEPSTTPSTAGPAVEVLSCEDIDTPYAPEDWYADTPIYVGNEMPIDEVRVFVQTLDGFRDVWIDRAHNGWIGVGFDDADVEAHQAALESEFPGVGVVAVNMPYTAGELEELSRDLQSRLPDGMETASIYEVQGFIEIWVGRLDPENIAAVSEVVGDAPVCISGQDPATTPGDGPQLEGGDGWSYLGEADAMPDTEFPSILADPAALSAMWGQLGIPGEPPGVDFEKQVVLSLVIGHSGSCPRTRLDDVVVDDSVVYVVVPTITHEIGCTDDWVPRTYLVGIDRDRLPAPPFQLAGHVGSGARVEIATDLRVPGSVPEAGDVVPAEAAPLGELTPMPHMIEPGFPSPPLTIDPVCGVDFLGEINTVHWHRAEGSGMPEEWDAAIVDGLLDLELMMTPGPEPTLTASAGGIDVVYLPGPETTRACD
ncbi:MAG: hypothetical protein ABWZ58_05835 [Acidimicrobiia bacterium]